MLRDILLYAGILWILFLLFYGIYLNNTIYKKENELVGYTPRALLTGLLRAPNLWTFWVTIVIAIAYNIANS